MPYDVQVKDVATQRVLAVRKHATPEHIGEVIGGAMAEVFTAASQGGAHPAGPPVIVHHVAQAEWSGGAIDVCVPVAGPARDAGEIKATVLEGGPVAFTIHRGPYEKIGPAYQALTGWIGEHGRQVAGAPREVYLTDPDKVRDPADYVTEIEWPIR